MHKTSKRFLINKAPCCRAAPVRRRYIKLLASVLLRLMILIRIKPLKITPKNQSEFDIFMQLCYNLNSKLRLASLRGATVEKMQN